MSSPAEFRKQTGFLAESSSCWSINPVWLSFALAYVTDLVWVYSV
jgi:hypothetical protein